MQQTDTTTHKIYDSFNKSSIGTTWLYKYNDVDMQLHTYNIHYNLL